jgi:hypothetical protein
MNNLLHLAIDFKAQRALVRATSDAMLRANLSNEALLNCRSETSTLCSGKRRPSAVVMEAASDDEERTRTSTWKAFPAACSIAAHSASAPPDSEGSLAPPMTRHATGLAGGGFMAQALPFTETMVTATATAAKFFRIELSDFLRWSLGYFRSPAIAISKLINSLPLKGVGPRRCFDGIARLNGSPGWQ